MDSQHVIDPEPFQNDFELSANTIKGKVKRDCPVCKKSHKVEQLGEHVHKQHPEFWSALFSIESLEKAIQNKSLVRCTIAESDHDQAFLVCLECNSIRTTDRNHFQKNGDRHLEGHLEIATRMIAKRRGVKYVPRAQTDMENILRQLDKFKRQAKYCEHEHSDIGAVIAEKEDLQQENIELRETVRRLNKGTEHLESILTTKDKMLYDINVGVKQVFTNIRLGNTVTEKDVLAAGYIMQQISRIASMGR
jgi:hypothetical protein